ncbi:NAD(P)-dependent oxidoreductase [Methylotenera sp. 1P/1]|uniref:NAD-dependent epimerase/dehydratase family protein n=1 Tax=Methylotenera sp. 1P/1 TaxID=1131551 RepID=UPI0003604684|nr:NAD(P)-dependent oxidoreductase [Methylotenera sp. 1P/1]
MHTIAITGATGFIGKHLVAELLRLGGFRIKLLTRAKNSETNSLIESGVIVVEGDLLNLESLNGFLEQDCTVINLVYLHDAGEQKNMEATNNLLHMCKSASVKRLIHCSTAAVVGRTPDNLVTENTVCQPVTEYGITKLKIETMILDTKDSFDTTILRPTAVFGIDGEPLKKLARDLITKRRLANYAKSCLFGKRRTNLVNIANVVAAIVFLIKRNENLRGETFIISDDDSENNNFVYTERLLMKALNVPDYRLPRLFVPPFFLTFLLACLGRNNINPMCNYSSNKLLGLGYQKACSFESSITEYANWYQSTIMMRQTSVL